MASNELEISGIHISKNVIATVVSIAVQHVEGVASVGGNDLASSLISVFSRKALPQDLAVESEVVDERLKISVHIAAFYGYPFAKLAEDVREAVVCAIHEQVGVDVLAVDVYIDSLVFPKE